MKKMIFCLILIATLDERAQACQGFEPVFKDEANGVSWGKVLEGRFSNLSNNSAAEKACKDICARLPTKLEIESLIRQFPSYEYRHGPRLSNDGKLEMAAIFGESVNFWSSTTHVQSPPEDAYIFFSQTGEIYYDFRHYEQPVRCVSVIESP